MAITLMANDNLRFGQPEKFIPERWLGDSLEAQEARARYPSFGFGPRTCMGRE
jgi:cytochrome P450